MAISRLTEAETETAAMSISDDLQESLKDDQIQMYKDVISLKREKGEPIPRKWLQGLAKLEGGSAKGDDWIYSDKVFGHPQATNIHGYQHLIPIKIKAGDYKTIERKLDHVQKVFDKLGTKLGKIEAIAKGRVRATPAQKKAAAKKLRSHEITEIQTIMDMLRDETMKELQSLYKEAKKG